jgi:hypothetical protein
MWFATQYITEGLMFMTRLKTHPFSENGFSSCWPRWGLENSVDKKIYTCEGVTTGLFETWWWMIVFRILRQFHFIDRRCVYLVGKGLISTGLDQRRDIDEKFPSDFTIDVIIILYKTGRWTPQAYRCIHQGRQMDLDFMAMEATSVTWCICSPPLLDESSSPICRCRW